MGSTTPRCCPTPLRLLARLIRWLDRTGERVLVFGDFDADGLTGLAIIDPCAAPARRRRRCRTCRAASRRATACRSPRSTRPRRRRVRHRHGRLRHDQPRRDRRRPRARHRRPRHRPPPRARRPAGRRSPSSTRIAPTAATRSDGWPAAAWRSRSPSCCSRDEPGGPAAALELADLATIGSVADVVPLVGENRAIARLGPGPAPDVRLGRGSRRCWSGRAWLRRGVDLETVSFALAPRLNAAGGSGRRWTPPGCCSPRTPDRGAALAPTRWRPPTATRRDLMKAARGRGPARSSPTHRTRRPTLVHGPWPVGIVGLVAVAARRGPGPAGRRRRRARRRHPGVVPKRRRSSTSARRSSSAATCSRVTAATPARRASRSRPSAGRRSGRGSSSLAAASAPADPRGRPADRSGPAGPGCRLRAVSASSRACPCGPGNPEPLVAVLGLTVTRVASGHRWPHPADPAPRTRRSRRDRVRPAGPRRDGP